MNAGAYANMRISFAMGLRNLIRAQMTQHGMPIIGKQYVATRAKMRSMPFMAHS